MGWNGFFEEEEKRTELQNSMRSIQKENESESKTAKTDGGERNDE